ncbi:MAG: hypothetical protein K6C14_08585 [Eubacterium sp.]|nr:hypothetical protein [Eubacterium sp.]
MKNKLLTGLSLFLSAVIIVLSLRFGVAPYESPALADATQSQSERLTSLPVESTQKEKTGEESTTAAKKEEPTTRVKIDKSIRKLNKKQRTAKFKGIIISGDSIVNSMLEYKIIGKSRVVAGVGAGTLFLRDSTEKIVKANPKYLILHYGENELDKKDNAVNFIKRYTSCIKALKKALPKTEIYVDSIFPVDEAAYGNEDEPYLKNIPYYNKLLKQMAKDTGVHYIDYTPIWNGYKKNYYDEDGIHPLASYYKEQYLPFIYELVHNSNKK